MAKGFREPMQAMFDMILQAKQEMRDCGCGAKVDQFKIVFPETMDHFGAVCLACEKGSAFIEVDDFSHPIPLMQLAKRMNRMREAVGYLVDQWNEHGGPFSDPGKIIHMSGILPDPEEHEDNIETTEGRQ